MEQGCPPRRRGKPQLLPMRGSTAIRFRRDEPAPVGPTESHAAGHGFAVAQPHPAPPGRARAMGIRFVVVGRRGRRRRQPDPRGRRQTRRRPTRRDHAPALGPCPRLSGVRVGELVGRTIAAQRHRPGRHRRHAPASGRGLLPRPGRVGDRPRIRARRMGRGRRSSTSKRAGRTSSTGASSRRVGSSIRRCRRWGTASRTGGDRS